MRKLRLLILALLIPVLALTACGGGDNDEDKIVEVIETSVTSTDPAHCTETATQAFLEQTEHREGKEAVEACEGIAEKTEDNPDSVEVSAVEVDGSNATADVAFEGGSFNGQTLSVALVEEDGNWKLDELTGFAEFDQEQFATSFEAAVQSEEAFDRKVASCTGKVIRKLPRPQVEELVLGDSADPIVEIVEGCLQG